MKHLKAKLMASVGMLLVAVIMMSTASYAWFTISTNPEIANVTANITSNGNLEIGLGVTEPKTSAVGDTGKNNTWGNLIDLQQAFKNSGNNVVTLKPTKLIATGSDYKTIEISYPSYNLDGRISAMKTLYAITATNDSASGAFSDMDGVTWYVSTYTDNGGTKKVTTNSDIYAFSVDYWLRTNTTPTDGHIKVTLASSSDRANGAANSQDGLGSYIDGDSKKSVTVLFRVHDTTDTWYIASRTDNVGDKYDIVLKEATRQTDGTIKASGTTEAYIELTQNTAKHVTMYVFIDGETMTNAEAYLELQKDFAINVQFEIEGLQDAMNVNMEQNNGRNS